MTDHSFHLARSIGRLEAIVEDHGRRLSKLEELPRRDGIPWRDLMPYAYGAAMILMALIAVLSGKLSIMEAVSTFGKGP